MLEYILWERKKIFFILIGSFGWSNKFTWHRLTENRQIKLHTYVWEPHILERVRCPQIGEVQREKVKMRYIWYSELRMRGKGSWSFRGEESH